MSKIALVVGATRGLGASIVKEYAARGDTVLGTSRSNPPGSTDNVIYIGNIDVATESAGSDLASAVKKLVPKVDILVITAGYFGTESFDEPSWDKQVKMYTTSSIAPVFIVHHLVRAGLMASGGKIILVSSESGSITLRHQSEGGGNYGQYILVPIIGKKRN